MCFGFLVSDRINYITLYISIQIHNKTKTNKRKIKIDVSRCFIIKKRNFIY